MKRFLSVFLSCVIIFSAFSLCGTAVAQGDETKKGKESVCPVVIVPGVGSSALYSQPNTESQASALQIEGNILSVVRDTHITRDLMRIAFGRSVEPLTFINKLSAITNMLTGLNCDSEGLSADGVGIDCYWTQPLSEHLDYLDKRPSAEPAVTKGICDAVGAENVWIYHYDFRLDVISHSDGLAEFIDEVKKQSGSEQVTLVSASLGTSVVSAYIDRYSERNDIAKSIFLDGAFQGTSVGKLFKKDIVIDEEIINTYLNLLAECYVADTVDFGQIKGIIDFFNNTAGNVITYLQSLTNEENIDAFYSRIVLPILGNMPSLWQCIPYDDFDEAVEKMTQIGWLDSSSGLYSTIQEYHAIQGRLEDNLKALQEKGVGIAIVCSYGLPQIPFTGSANEQSDMLIDTAYASFGGTTGKANQKIEAATSPDGFINSSTCKFEKNTWFVKGVQHMEFVYDTDINRFIAYLTATSDKMNIESVNKSKGYAQFMEIDSDYIMTNVK